MSQAGKLYYGGTGSSALATTIIADVGQAHGRNNILNALGGSNINTAAIDLHTIQVNTNSTIAVDVANIGNISISDKNITSLNSNGNIVLSPASGQKVTYDNAEINPNSFLYFADNSRLRSTASATDGQILIGSSSGNPVAANITAGENITLTNNSNNITLSTVGAGQGFVTQWVQINNADYPAGQNYTYQMQRNTGYILNWYGNSGANPTVLSLTFPPLVSLQIGDFFSIICNGAYGCYTTNYDYNVCSPATVYVDPTVGGYAIIAPYQTINIVTTPIRPITYGTGGAGGKPAISFVYTGTDVNLVGGNQPLFQVVHSMGVWKY